MFTVKYEKNATRKQTKGLFYPDPNFLSFIENLGAAKNNFRGYLIWPPANRGYFLRPPCSENKSRAAQMARPLNHIATTDLRAARMKMYKRANIAGRGPETALVSSVSGSLAFLPAG